MTKTTDAQRLGGFAEHWCETVAYPAYNKACHSDGSTVSDPRDWLHQFMQTDAAIPFVAADTDKWTTRRLGDYLHRLAYENMAPAAGDLNYPYTG